MTRPDGQLLNHAYDDIQEFDNPLPRWWSLLFWASVFFSVPYFIYYTYGVGETLQEGYDAETASFFEVIAKQLGDIKPNEPTLLRLAQDQKMMMTGRVLFKSNCATCHAPDGGGGTGPNLTDDSYINIAQVTDLYRVIHDGVPAKGMPTWSKNFSDPQLVVLASYVASLRGTTPANPKAAQGNPIPPWPAAPPPEPAKETPGSKSGAPAAAGAPGAPAAPAASGAKK